MVDKLGLFSRIFTKKADKKQKLAKAEGVQESQQTENAKGINQNNKVTVNTIWDGARTEGHTNYQNTYRVSADPYMDEQIRGLGVKFGDTPEVAQRNTAQTTLDPGLINENDPNYISDLAQGFEEREFCEV